MKLINITLNDDQLPAKAVAELTIDEMIWITRVTGRQNFQTAEELVPGFGAASSEVYHCLSGGLFNRFWECGLDGAIRGDVE